MAARRTRFATDWGRRGITLMELMVSMSVMTLVLGAVLLLQLQGLRIYQDVSATDWASFEAATAVGLMEEDTQAAFRVIGRYPNRITLSMPRTAWNATQSAYLPTQPLQFGDSVRYYLSDVTGTFGRQGSYLWRAVKPVGGTSWVLGKQPLADSIKSLQFTYTMAPAPRSASVASVTLTVVAEVKQGGTTRLCTHSSQIVLRNVQYGPVTAETGKDT